MSEFVRIGDKRQERQSARHTKNAGHGPAARNRVNDAGRVLKVTPPTPDGNVPDTGGGEVVLNIKGRDSSILSQVSTQRDLLARLAR